MIRPLLIMLLAAMLAGCGTTIDVEPPPEVDSQPADTGQLSRLQVPVTLPLGPVQAAVEREVPKKLWAINRKMDACVPGERVKALGREVKVTPDISCRLEGQVTRGAITLGGRGERITLSMPISAVIAAKDVGGIIKQETATARATVRMTARLSMSEDWTLKPKVDIDYGWREAPGIDILGQRVEFTSRADRELQGVVRQIERQVERELARVDVKSAVEAAWRQGFAVLSLNKENPPVWMTIAPEAVGVDGYAINGREATVRLSLAARTASYVGDRPAAPEAVPLPPRSAGLADPGITMLLPVLADYDELEPVVLRELKELAAKGITLPGAGAVDVEFRSVSIHATENGRLAVGVDAKIVPEGSWWARAYGTVDGMMWLTGLPVNEENSTRIAIRDFALYGESDRRTVNLIGRMLLSPQVQQRIGTVLTEDFHADYDALLADVREAVADLREGPWRIAITVDDVRHGKIAATGAGLYLPVMARGTGTIALAR